MPKKQKCMWLNSKEHTEKSNEKTNWVSTLKKKKFGQTKKRIGDKIKINQECSLFLEIWNYKFKECILCHDF